jgi:hypothetical protein
MLHAAVEAGLEFLGVTDHNNVAHHAEYGPGGGAWPIVIPGVEVTTYHGHWNAWGTDRWWEFRDPTDAALDRSMTAAARAGAFVSVNHPKPFGPPWEYDTLSAAHAIEVWNGTWTGLNTFALDTWEARLVAGHRLVAVGGSDTHLLRSDDPDQRHSRGLGIPTTWVEAGSRPDASTVLDGMRAGRTFVSASPSGPQLYVDRDRSRLVVEVRDGEGQTLVIVGDGKAVASEAIGDPNRTVVIDVPATSYVRAQLVGSTGEIRALTSPLWLR